MRFRTCGLKRIQLSVTSATCVHAQQLFILLLVATKVALPINGVKPVQAIAQEPIGNSVETLARDKPQALHHICEATAHGGFFSGAVLVAENSRVIYRKAFGLANREWKIPNSVDTKFRLASVSKQFCSMIIMQLIQEEKIALNDPITKHLLYYRKDQGDKITLHHLLAHQSGIPDFTNSFNYRNTTARLLFEKDDFIQRFCSGDLTHNPGELYSYSNAGYVILGRIIEKVTNRSYEQNIFDRITQPLGMTNTGYDNPQKILSKRASGYTHGPFRVENSTYIEMDPAPGAAGAVYSTIDDLFLWERALATDTLLKKFYRELMFTPNTSVPESQAAGGRPHSNYGYGWRINSVAHPTTGRSIRVMSHGGAINGFRAIVSRIPDRNAYVALLCNQGDLPGSNPVWQTLNRMNTEILHVVTEQPYKIPPQPKPTQEKKLYEIVCSKGADAAISWFKKNGERNPWGGSFNSVARELIRSEKKEEALLLYEHDIHQAPNKIWLHRKLVELCIQMGKFKKANSVLKQALLVRPGDERLIELQNEIRHRFPEQELRP